VFVWTWWLTVAVRYLYRAYDTRWTDSRSIKNYHHAPRRILQTANNRSWSTPAQYAQTGETLGLCRRSWCRATVGRWLRVYMFSRRPRGLSSLSWAQSTSLDAAWLDGSHLHRPWCNRSSPTDGIRFRRYRLYMPPPHRTGDVKQVCLQKHSERRHLSAAWQTVNDTGRFTLTITWLTVAVISYRLLECSQLSGEKYTQPVSHLLN